MFTIWNQQPIVSESNYSKPWTGLSAATLANSADPDQTPQNAASDEGLLWLLKLQEIKG